MALTKIDDRGLKTPIDLLINEKIRFGTGNDLEIYHDSNCIIHNKTGQTWIQGSELYLSSNHTDLQEVYLKAVANGAIELYNDGTKKFETTSNGIQVENSTATAITVVSADNTDGGVYFNDGTNQGGVIYQHNGDYMSFRTSGTDDRIRIDTNGNVGIGIDPDGYYSDKLVLSCAGEDGITLKNTTGDTTNYIMFANADSGAGRYAGWIAYAHANNWMRITVNDDTAGKYFTFKSDGDLELGHGNLKVPAGRGIDFSNQTWTSTGNTNDEILDHYEEGTFIPTLTGASSNPTQSYAHQRASFTRIGNLVHITVDVEMAASGVSAGSGNLCLSGLPWPKNSAAFSLGSGAGPAYGVSCSVGFVANLGSNYPNAAYANDNDSYLLLTRTTASSMAYCDAAAITNSSRIIIGATYRTTG